MQRQGGLAADFWVLRDHPRKRECDISLHQQQRNVLSAALVRFGMFLFCLFQYDVFHFYFGQSLLPMNLDLPVLVILRKRVVMSYCGSDIRLFRVDKRRHPFCSFLEKTGFTSRRDVKCTVRLWWHRLWIRDVTAPRNLYRYACSVFPKDRVHTVPVNNVDIIMRVGSSCAPPRDSDTERRLRVVHAPTNRKVKGTELIEKAITALKTEGMEFEYRRLEGLSHQQCVDALQDADIVVDQVIVGGMGSLSFESLLMGKTLCVYVIDEICQMLGGDLPIINTPPDKIQESLRTALADEGLRKKFAREGPRFVREYLQPAEILVETLRLYGFSEDERTVVVNRWSATKAVPASSMRKQG